MATADLRIHADRGTPFVTGSTFTLTRVSVRRRPVVGRCRLEVTTHPYNQIGQGTDRIGSSTRRVGAAHDCTLVCHGLVATVRGGNLADRLRMARLCQNKRGAALPRFSVAARDIGAVRGRTAPREESRLRFGYGGEGGVGGRGRSRQRWSVRSTAVGDAPTVGGSLATPSMAVTVPLRFRSFCEGRRRS